MKRFTGHILNIQKSVPDTNEYILTTSCSVTLWSLINIRTTSYTCLTTGAELKDNLKRNTERYKFKIKIEELLFKNAHRMERYL